MPKSIQKKTASERLLTVNETKLKCIEHNLMDDLATKILFRMLNNYHRDGTTYIGKELKLNGRYDTPRKYVVNLYNQRGKMDVVLIRALNEDEIRSLAARRRAAERNAKSVYTDWQRDASACVT